MAMRDGVDVVRMRIAVMGVRVGTHCPCEIIVLMIDGCWLLFFLFTSLIRLYKRGIEVVVMIRVL